MLCIDIYLLLWMKLSPFDSDWDPGAAQRHTPRTPPIAARG